MYTFLNKKRTSLFVGILSFFLFPSIVFSFLEPQTYYFDRVTYENKAKFETSNQTGAFEYSIPIVLPEDPILPLPSLALQYNSQTRENSILGYGWNLPIPYIERLPEKGVVSMYSDNIFSSLLDGELTLITGQEYAPKLESGSFNKYTFDGTSWTVTTKEGTVLTFGSDSNSVISDPSDATRQATWMLSTIIDTNGNSISYTYFKDLNEVYVSNIDYAFRGGSTSPYSVNFTYTDNPDEPTKYHKGFPTTLGKLLDTIEVQVNGVWTRRYTISYTENSPDTRSRVISAVQEIGRDEVTLNTISLPAHIFEYSKANSIDWVSSTTPSGQIPRFTSYIYPIPRDFPVRVVDMNGDAYPDIAFRHYVDRETFFNDTLGSFNTDSTNVAPTRISGADHSSNSWTDRGVRFIDVNGDTLTDTLVSNDDGAWVWFGSLDSTNFFEGYSQVVTGLIKFASGNGGGRPTPTRFGDVNGDGLIDVIYAVKENSGNVSTAVYINQVDGTSFVYDPAYNVPFVFHDYTWPDENADDGDFADTGTRLIDLNGDGLIDALQSYTSYSGVSTMKRFINKGDGTGWTEQSTANLPQFAHEFWYDRWQSRDVRVIDLNNDGLQDFILNDSGPVPTSPNGGYAMRLWFYINNGANGFTRKEFYTAGSNFAYPLASDGANDRGLRYLDLNADGVTDMIQISTINNGPEIRTYHQGVSGENVHYAHLLTHVDTSNGLDIDVTYGMITKERDENENIENTRTRFNYPVVKEVHVTDPNFNSSEDQLLEYHYTDAEYFFEDNTEKRIAGFGTVTVTNGLGNVTKSFFHQGNDSQTSIGEHSDHRSKIGRAFRVEEYDDSGNLYRQTITKWMNDDLGNDRDFVYAEDVLVQSYDGDGDHKDSATSYTYDSYGNLTLEEQFGEVVGNNDGTFTDIGTDKRSISRTYTNNTTDYIVGLPTTETLRNNTSVIVADKRFYYDNLGLGSITTGNLTKEEHWISGANWADTDRSYNTFGNAVTETDPRNNTTTFVYDAHNLYPATVTNAENLVTSFTYDYSSGEVRTTTDPNGFVFETVYDALDRPIEEKIPDHLGTPSNRITKTTLAYNDAVGNRSVTETNYLTGSNTTLSYTYLDGFDRVIQNRTEAEDTNQFVVVDSKYDANGNVSQTSLPYFSAGSARTAMTTDPDLLITNSYDALDRVTTIVNTGGSETHSYDQWEEVVTDREGNTKDYQSDAFGNLVEVDEHSAAAVYDTQYEYNALNNLTKITDEHGNVRNFVYDGLARLTNSEDLHGPSDSTFGTYSYSYDDAGNQTSMTDPNGNTVNYSYDDINRVLTEDFTSEAGIEITYSYDSCTNGDGRLCSVTTDDVTTANSYDALGNIVSETRTINSTPYTTGFSYDRQGNQTSITYPESTVLTYGYNSAGQLETATFGSNTIIADIDYGPTGQVTYREYGNGVGSTYTYDADELYRLKNIKTEVVQAVLGTLAMIDPDSGEIVEFDNSKRTGATKDKKDTLVSISTEPPSNTELMRQFETPSFGPVVEPLDRLIKSESDANAWKKFHRERKAFFEANPDLVPEKLRLEAVKNEGRFNSYFNNKGFKEEKAQKKPNKLISLINSITTALLPEKAFALIFGREDFESCGSLPCSFNWGVGWGSVSTSLNATGQVNGDDSLETVVSGAGSGAYEVADLNSGELYFSFDLYVPSNMQWGPAGYAGIARFEDSANNGVLWLNMENWGSPRLTINGNVLSYTDTGLNLVEGQVNHIEMRVKMGTTNGDVDIWVNNFVEASPDYDGSGSMNLGSPNIDDIHGGITYVPDSGLSTVYFDDFEIDSFFVGDPNTGGGSGPGTVFQDLSYTYDNVGNITNIVDDSPVGTGKDVNFVYDDLYRLTSASTNVASSSSFSRTYSYDPLGNITNKSDQGAYSYAETGYTNPHAVTDIAGTSYTYDNNGNVTSIGSETYHWDYRNRLVSIGGSGSGGPGVAEYLYNEGREPGWASWSWNVTLDQFNTEQVYDGTYSEKVIYTGTWGGYHLNNGANMIDTTAYDNIRFAFRSTTGGETIYLRALDPTNTQYGEVIVNNYISGGSIAANTWYDIVVPLSDINAVNVDVRGLYIMSNVATTLYVDEWRIEEATGSGPASNTFGYDHNNLRVVKDAVVYPNGYYNTNTTSGVETLHIMSPDGTNVATVVDGVITYTHTDHLGGTNVVTDRTAGVTETIDYYPFGEQRISDLQSGTAEQRKFTGHEYDGDSDLTYARARYLDQDIGKFLSQDPASRDNPQQFLQDPQLQNAYSYVGNNPVNLTDPTGQCPWCLPFLVGGAAGGISQYASDIIANREAGITGAAAFKARSSWQEYNTAVAAGAGAAATAVFSLPGAAAVSIFGSGVGDLAGGRDIDPGRAFTTGLVTLGTGGFLKWGIGPVPASNFVRSVTVGETFQGAVGAIFQARYQATQNYNSNNGSSNYQNNLYVTPSGAVVSGGGDLVAGPPSQDEE